MDRSTGYGGYAFRLPAAAPGKVSTMKVPDMLERQYIIDRMYNDTPVFADDPQGNGGGIANDLVNPWGRNTPGPGGNARPRNWVCGGPGGAKHARTRRQRASRHLGLRRAGARRSGDPRRHRGPVSPRGVDHAHRGGQLEQGAEGPRDGSGSRSRTLVHGAVRDRRQAHPGRVHELGMGQRETRAGNEAYPL